MSRATETPLVYEGPADCPVRDIPLVRATPASLRNYGRLVPDPDACRIEVVQWPAPGWRPVEPGTGDEGGTTEGIFASTWDGPVLRAVNEAVQGDYVIGRSMAGGRVAFWHANYHPDGGQLFFPLDGGAFVAPLALPGDDIAPEDFVAFWFDGSKGLYIHPGIWHEGVFPVAGRQRFFDRQGKVHARINADFVPEFGCCLAFPLAQPTSP